MYSYTLQTITNWRPDHPWNETVSVPELRVSISAGYTVYQYVSI